MDQDGIGHLPTTVDPDVLNIVHVQDASSPLSLNPSTASSSPSYHIPHIPLQRRGPPLTIRVPKMSQSLHPCRWDWCKQILDTEDELAEHVLLEHVAKAVPMKRKDFRLYRRVEQGFSLDGSNTASNFRSSDVYDVFMDDKDDIVVSQAEDGTFGADKLMPVTPTPSSRKPARIRATLSPHPHQLFRQLAGVSSPKVTPRTTPLGPSPSLADLVANTVKLNSRFSAPPGARSGRSPSPLTFTSKKSYAQINTAPSESRHATPQLIPLNIIDNRTDETNNEVSASVVYEGLQSHSDTTKTANNNSTPYIFRSGTIQLSPAPANTKDRTSQTVDISEDPSNLLESQFLSNSQWPYISQTDGSQWGLQTQASYNFDSQSQF